MQRTPEQLRAELEAAHQAALAAPGQEAAGSDWARVSRLEAELRKLEDTPEKVRAERDKLLQESQQLGWKLSAAERESARLAKRVTWLEAIIAHQIGRPVEGLTDAKLAFKLDDVKDQRNKLAAAIGAAKDMEGLNKAKDIARNMGLISRENAA